jgi:sirohydrochlorin cobaltochelatase
MSRGVLLIGHGTRDALGTEQFFQLAERLATTLSPLPVAPALLEFQSPTIDQAWQSLVERDVKHIHVAPLLLFAAGHAKDDIPAVIRGCQSRTPAVTFDQSMPLSRHRSLVNLVVANLRQTLDRRSLRSPTALVMVGRGNRDPCAQADMRVLSQVVAARLDVAATYTAFYAMAEPKLRDVLSHVADRGEFDAIVIHPHLLFAGRLHDAIGKQVEESAHKFPHISFILAPYLGPVAEVATAIAHRIHGVSGPDAPTANDYFCPSTRKVGFSASNRTRSS